MNKLIKFFASLLLFSMFSALHAQDNNEGIQFITDQSFENILEIAKAENKTIFIDCYADWCGPCKKLAKDVFPQKEVGDFFNANFINVKYNTEEGEGKKFYNDHKDAIPGLPTMLLINNKGEIIHSIVGYREANDLVAEAKQALSGKTLTSLEQKYKEGDRNIELVKDYFSALKKAYRNDDAKKVAEEYRANLPVESLLDPDIWSMAKEYIVNPFSPDYQFVTSNMYKFEMSLKEDMPALERQLYRSMQRAVKDLLPQYEQKTVMQATIDSVATLREILEKNVLKGSADMLGKFKIAEFMRNDESINVFNFITFAQDVSLYRHEGLYLQGVYEYIANNIDDTQILKRSLEAVNKLQDKENRSSMPANFYASMIVMYNKLGDTDKAEKAQLKHDELEEQMQEKIKKFMEIFGDGKEK